MSSILQLPKTSCCGCSACSLSCPMQLIRMTPDAEGFLYPEIQYPERCIHCDKCEKVCPIINVDTIQIPTHNQQVYAGFVRETTYLQKSASGGIASAISQKIINEGGEGGFMGKVNNYGLLGYGSMRNSYASLK